LSQRLLQGAGKKNVLSSHVQNFTIVSYSRKYQKDIVELNATALDKSKKFNEKWNPKWNADLEKIEEIYLKNGGAFLVLLVDEKLIGTGALLKVDEKTVKAKRLRIHPAYQQKGLSMLLMSELEKKARELNYRKLVADIVKCNVPAEKVLLKTSFAKSHETYFDGVLCVLFEKELG